MAASTAIETPDGASLQLGWTRMLRSDLDALALAAGASTDQVVVEALQPCLDRHDARDVADLGVLWV